MPMIQFEAADDTGSMRMRACVRSDEIVAVVDVSSAELPDGVQTLIGLRSRDPAVRTTASYDEIMKALGTDVVNVGDK